MTSTTSTCFFRDNELYEVVAFTAAQIPNIDDRQYPPNSLAGFSTERLSPSTPRRRLSQLIKRNKVEQVVFAYSDISHIDLMHKGSFALASGAEGLPPDGQPVIVPGVEGAGPSASPPCARLRGRARPLAEDPGALKEHDRCVVAIRDTFMPYGDLVKQRVQRSPPTTTWTSMGEGGV